MDFDNANLKHNADLRYEARELLRGRWGQTVLACLLFTIVTGAAAGLGGIGTLIIGGPMELGLVIYFLSLRREGDTQMEFIFRGFRYFENTIVLYVVRTLFVFLWSLLLIVPGIIAALKYSMAFYILHDNPELTGMEALNRSKDLMEGFKGKLFSLYLSFIGWGFLCIFTLGIGYFWLFPYIKASEMNFYEDLKSAPAV